MKAKAIFFSLIFPLVVGATTKPPHDGGHPLVVIDPGHGGKDPGAVHRKVREKDLALAFSKKLSQQLKRNGINVYLTRNHDRTVTLEGRNRLANSRSCDLFVSLHANASKNRKAHGVEIYYLNKATDQASQRLATRENREFGKKQAVSEAILSDLIQTDATLEAAEAAKAIRQSLKKVKKIRGPTIKTALFSVLVGTKCPGLLIETGFVTHSEEARLLKDSRYQSEFSKALALGIIDFLKKRSLMRSNL